MRRKNSALRLLNDRVEVGRGVPQCCQLVNQALQHRKSVLTISELEWMHHDHTSCVTSSHRMFTVPDSIVHRICQP